jgi:putative heme iron utilization protein
MEIRNIGIEENTGFPFAIADVNIIDVDYEQGQTFDMANLDAYGRGDQLIIWK